MDGGGPLFSVTLRRTARPVAEPHYRRALGRVVPKPNGRVEARKSPERDRRAEPPRWCPFCVDRAGFVGLRLHHQYITHLPTPKASRQSHHRAPLPLSDTASPSPGLCARPGASVPSWSRPPGRQGLRRLAKVMHAHPRLAHAGEPRLNRLGERSLRQPPTPRRREHKRLRPTTGVHRHVCP